MNKPLTAVVVAVIALASSGAIASTQAGKTTKPGAAPTHSARHVVVRRPPASACVSTEQLIVILMTNQPLPSCLHTVGRPYYDPRPPEYIGGAPYDSPMAWD
jgi:hypothetical protein